MSHPVITTKVIRTRGQIYIYISPRPGRYERWCDLTFRASKRSIDRGQNPPRRPIYCTKKRVNHPHQVPEEDSIASRSHIVVNFDPSRVSCSDLHELHLAFPTPRAFISCGGESPGVSASDDERVLCTLYRYRYVGDQLQFASQVSATRTTSESYSITAGEQETVF